MQGVKKVAEHCIKTSQLIKFYEARECCFCPALWSMCVDL